MNKCTLLWATLLSGCSLSLWAQAPQISVEQTATPPKFTKGDQISDVVYNEDGTTTLRYFEEQPLATYFKDYTFNDQFELTDHKIETYDVGQQLQDAWREAFGPKNYKGETYTVEGVSVSPTLNGKLVVRKKETTWNFMPRFGGYYPTVKFSEPEKLNGADDNRVYLYHRAEDYQTGNVVLIVGNKAAKGSKIKNQHTRHFQIMTISKDLDVAYKEEVKFDYAVCINYARVIDRPGLGESFVDDEIGDLSRGDLAVVFSPMKSMFTGKTTHSNPGEHTLVIIGADGAIKSKQTLNTPSSGWFIEDMIQFEGGDIIAYGPAKADKFVNSIKSTNSPLTSGSVTNETRWNDFQLMKLNANYEQVYLKATSLDVFKDKLVTPPSQRRAPSYIGKRFDKTQIVLAPNGDVLISGQKYTLKKVPAVDENGKTITDRDGETVYTQAKSYGDLLLFHFDQTGDLKSQYGVRRDRMNRFSRETLTPVDLYFGKNDNTVYWVYGEIQGYRKGWDIDLIGYNATAVKAKLLYYPTVAKIDLNAGKVTDFTPLGQDAKGKQRYYTNPNFPQLYVPGSHLTFVGEDKTGKQIWFARLDLE